MRTNLRKKLIPAALVTVLLFCLGPVRASAEQAVVTGSEVNVRTGAGTSYEIFATLARGTTVEVISRANPDWYLVSWEGNSGFVSSQFLDLGGESSTEDVYGGTPLYPISGSSDSGTASQGSTTLYPVQESPKPEATLPPDQIVRVPTDGTAHTASESDGSGLVVSTTDSSPYLVDSSAETPTPTPTPAPVQPAASIQANTAAASSGSTIGRITGNAVRLRTGPGTTYSIVGTYNSGAEVSITGISGGWTAVSIPGTGVSGYVYSDYVETSAGSTSAGLTDTAAADGTYSPASYQIKDGFITGSSVRLRNAPSMSAEILDELNFGTAVRMTGISGDWTRVIANGKEGYVSSAYVAEGAFEPAAGITKATGTELGKEIAAYALQYVGTPYKWGGSSPETGFDCSGFVQYVFGQFGYTTSRVANDALSDGVHVDAKDMQPGDLLCFYSGNNYVGHLGIYIGDDMFVHAANSASGVVTTSLSTGYYAIRGYEVRRII